jgi:hypothetical protein
MPVFAHEIQEEQGDIQPKHIVVAVTGGSHHLAPPPLIFANTDQPRLDRPALLEQRPGRRIVDDPPVAGEQASLRYRDDLTERRDRFCKGMVLRFRT